MQKVITLVKTLKNKTALPDVVSNLVSIIKSKKGFVKLITTLSDNEACDVIFEAPDLDKSAEEDLYNIADKNKMDFFLTDNVNRRKKLIICDMDSTIIEQECVDEIAFKRGITDNIKEITDLTMEGKMDFNESLKARVALLKDLEIKYLEEIYKDKITFSPGAQELISTMKKNGSFCILVSGGFTFFTEKVSKALGFNEHYGNILKIKDNKLTGEVVMPILDTNAKKLFLEKYVQKLGINIQDSIAVGDGANDLDVLKAAGTGVAYHAKSFLKERIKYKIEYTSLKSILFLQGYRNQDIVRDRVR